MRRRWTGPMAALAALARPCLVLGTAMMLASGCGAASDGPPLPPATAAGPSARPPAGTPGETGGPTLEGPGQKVPLIEASGITVRGGGKVAVIGGDETANRLYGVSLADFSTRWELLLPANTPMLDDIESIAPWGETEIFVACSQSRTKPRGKERPNRDRLALMTLAGDATVILRARVYEGLRDHLIRYLTGPLRDLFANPQAIADETPIKGGLNVEGMAAWNGQLLLGLRSPLARGGSVVIPIRDPAKLFTEGGGGAPPDFGKPFIVPTEPGEGIRGMAASGNRILILLGSPTDVDQPGYRIAWWDPATNEVKKAHAKGFKGIAKPEGIAFEADGRLLVVQDQKPPITKPIIVRLEVRDSE